MEFSDYENIEIFNNTQSFDVNNILHYMGNQCRNNGRSIYPEPVLFYTGSDLS
jgi:hypothetical protein